MPTPTQTFAPTSTSGSTTPTGAPPVNLNVVPPSNGSPTDGGASLKAPLGGPIVSSPTTPTTGSPTGPTSKPIDYAAIQAQLNAIKAQALKIQASAATLNDNNTTDNSGVVTSSTPEVNNENNTKSTVNGLAAGSGTSTSTVGGLGAAIPGASADGAANGNGPDTSSAQNASDQYAATLQTYMAQLEQRRAAEIASINSDFAEQQTELGQSQKSETGSTTAMLARAGGYLGSSGSGTGVLLNLAQTHATEVANLESKKQAAIQAAQSAIDDSEFGVAEKMAQNAKDIEQTINDRKQQFFDDTQKVIDEQRNDSQFQQTKVQDDLKALSGIDPATIPQGKKDEIDQYYGTPGFTDKYIAAQQAATQADTQAKVLANQKNMLDLLQSIPEGKTVTMPDGTTYTGIGKTSDITTFMETDNNGVGHLVTYNKGSGAISVTSVGDVGKASSAGVAVDPSTSDNVQALLQENLEKSKDPSTGQYDPQTYIKQRELIKQAYPSLLKDLDSKFLNPSNGFFSDDAIKYLRSQGIYVGAAALAGGSDVVPDATDDSVSPGQ